MGKVCRKFNAIKEEDLTMEDLFLHDPTKNIEVVLMNIRNKSCYGPQKIV